jgi:ribulose-5-phosphate 4-epimerase/fuculose-1-phosphate aldolase
MATTLKPLDSAISAEEWQVRVDLAAFYRLAALHGYDDLIFTHISARVPGPENHFLINPFGLMFEEITASSLVKVDLDGNLIGPADYGINRAGYVIHSALHAGRDDAHFIAHFHTDDGVAVSAQREGILPLNQRALWLLPNLSYHDYEGVAENLDERERLVADLGPVNTQLLLRNHGTLALGATAGQAWLDIYALEKSCTAQVRTLSAGREGVLIAPEEGQAEVRRQFTRNNGRMAALAWTALRRKLDRVLPGYAT